MFGLFKNDPLKQLEKRHARLLEEAVTIQRSGDLRAYAAKIEEAERLQAEIDALREQKK